MNPLVELAMRHAEREIDKAFCKTLEKHVQSMLDHGARVDDLPKLMEPILACSRAHRLEALATCQAVAEQYVNQPMVH